MHKDRKLTNVEQVYKKTVVPKLMKVLGRQNPMAVPRLQKCVINMGVGKATEDVKVLDEAAKELSMITGQKPSIRKAKKSISNFKIRQGQPIGAMVTLRGERMYEFLDRLMNVALPRIRDFRGVSVNGFDGQGNYTMGLKEQSMFPEVVSDRITRVQGMDITFVTTAQNEQEGLYLLYLLGMPFRGKNELLKISELN